MRARGLPKEFTCQYLGYSQGRSDRGGIGMYTPKKYSKYNLGKFTKSIDV